MANDTEIDVRIGADSSAVSTGMSKAADAVQAGLAKIKASFDSIGNPFAKIASKEAAAEAKESLESLASPLERLKSGFAALAVVMAGGELGEIGLKAAEYGESIEHASEKTGIATDKLQELRFAAGMVDLGFDTLQKSMGMLALKLAEAGDSASPVNAALKALGLNAKDLKALSPEEQLKKIADAFAGANDSGDKAAIAMALFGRGGREMIPFLNQGAAAIQTTMDKAKQLGIVFGESALGEMSEYAEQIKQVHAVHEAMANQVGLALIPSLMSVSRAFAGGLQEGGPFKTFLDGLSETITIVTIAVSHVAQSFQELGTIIGATAAQIANPMDWNVIQQDAEAGLQKIAAGWEKFREELREPLPNTAAEQLKNWDIDFGGKKKDLHFNVEKPKKPEKEQEPPSRVGGWEADLAIMKVTYQTENNLREMSKAEEAKYWQDKLSMADLTTAEVDAINKRSAMAQLEALKKAATEKKAITAEEIADAEARANASVSIEEELADRRVQLGLMTETQMLQQERQFEEQKFQIAETAQQARIAAALNDPNITPSALQKVKDELLRIEEAHALAVSKIQTKQAVDATADAQKMFDSIKSGFGQILTNLLSGTLTLRNAMRQAFSAITQASAQMVSDTLMKKAAGWAQETALYQAFLGTKTAADSTAATTTIATKATEADAVVTANAGEAASGAAASVASTPYVGWALAAAAFVAVMAMVLGAKGGGKSAAGGYDVPLGVNPMTQLHAEEMVLPAKHANVIRSMAEGGAGGGGDTHVHTWNINAPVDRKWFKDHGAHIVESIVAQRRNFNPRA